MIVVVFDLIPFVPLDTIFPHVCHDFFTTSLKQVINIFAIICHVGYILLAIIVDAHICISVIVEIWLVPSREPSMNEDKFILCDDRVPRIVYSPPTVNIVRLTALAGTFGRVINRTPHFKLLQVQGLLVESQLVVVFTISAVDKLFRTKGRAFFHIDLTVKLCMCTIHYCDMAITGQRLILFWEARCVVLFASLPRVLV